MVLACNALQHRAFVCVLYSCCQKHACAHIQLLFHAQQHMEDAELVISHAGSGSLFEGLALRKAIVAVPNPILMHNHQAELAGKLAADK